MPRNEVQISASISKPTRDLIERYARATGIKKGHLIEQALLHHLRALEELPAEYIVPPRIVLERSKGEFLLDRIEKPRRPARALKDIMGQHGDPPSPPCR